jgi:hypothetical protein
VPYATLAEVRAEGVPNTAPYTDARVNDRLELATEYIERICGMYFTPTTAALRLNGSGLETLLLPQPLLSLTSVSIDGTNLTSSQLAAVLILSGNKPGADDRRNPRLYWRDNTFTRGTANVVVTGSWGFVDGSSGSYRTPRAIRDVCIRLVLLDLDLIGDPIATRERKDATFGIRHAVHNRSVDLSELAVSGGATGDTDIDRVLAKHRRPLGGAVF